MLLWPAVATKSHRWLSSIIFYLLLLHQLNLPSNWPLHMTATLIFPLTEQLLLGRFPLRLYLQCLLPPVLVHFTLQLTGKLQRCHCD